MKITLGTKRKWNRLFIFVRKQNRIVFAALLAVLLTVPGLPVSLVEAAPTLSETAPPPSETEAISVLSVTVNVNTETGSVFTELILSNNGSEDTEVTFPLPEISTGMKLDTLIVKGVGGEELTTDQGVVTLPIKAGGNAGVSYSYRPRINLNNVGTILFDLRPLAKQFSDRIGHLEWTVDMPEYELLLVDMIQPINYLVGENRIKVVLDNFLVTSLLDRVYVSRTTHQELLADIDRYEENLDLAHTDEWVSDYGWTAEDVERYKRSNENEVFVYRFLAEHYREWFRDPDYKDTARYYKNKYKENVFEDDYVLSSGYEEEIILPGSFYQYLSNYWDMRGDQDFYEIEMRIMEYLRCKEENRRISSGSLALDEQLFPDEPKIYVVLQSDQQEMAGKKLLSYYLEHGSWSHPLPGMPGRGEEGYDYTKRDYELFFRCLDYDSFSKPVTGPAIFPEYRIIRIDEKDLDTPEVLQDYLNALKADMVFRSEYLLKDSSEYRSLSDEDRSRITEALFSHRSMSPMILSYGGTDGYSFDAFQADLKRFSDLATEKYSFFADCYPILIRNRDPLEGVLDIPIITQYEGLFFPPEDLISRSNTDPEKGMTIGASFPTDSLENVLVKQDFPVLSLYLDDLESVWSASDLPQIRNDRDEALLEEQKENDSRLLSARKELMLPSPDSMGVVWKSDFPKVIPKKISEKDDEIMIRSLTITIDPDADTVTTELILHSTKSEDTELVLLLPVISEDLQESAMEVEVKTSDGSPIQALRTKAVLPIRAGSDAGLTYSYRTPLANKDWIEFDLTEAVKQFHDHIEHFSWNVVLQPYDFPLLRRVYPADYTVQGQQISVTMDDFDVNNQTKEVFLSRATPDSLKEEIWDWGCYLSDSSYDGILAAEYIADHYRDWYMDPEFSENIIRDDNPDGTDRSAVHTVVNLYLHGHHNEVFTEFYYNAYVNELDYLSAMDAAGLDLQRVDEDTFSYVMMFCQSFEKLILGDPDYDNMYYDKVHRDINLILSGIMEPKAPEESKEPSSETSETASGENESEEATDPSETPDSHTPTPSAPEHRNEEGPKGIFGQATIVIVGVLLVLGAIAWIVVRLLRKKHT